MDAVEKVDKLENLPKKEAADNENEAGLVSADTT